MKFSSLATYLAIGTNLVHTASIPDANALSIAQSDAITPRSILSPDNALEKRKGGGGGGKGGGGGSSSGGKTSSSGGGSSSRPSSSNSGSGGTRAGGLNGGMTGAGSGPPRTYGGGAYYGGGAAVPYKAGSPNGKSRSPGPLLGVGAAAAIMPGVWVAGAYPYVYTNHYRFHNSTRRNSTRNSTSPQNKARFLDRLILRQTQQDGQEEDLPVVCLCANNAVCGCEENEDQKYLNDLVGDGNYEKLNKTLVNVGDYENEKHLIINGTLPEGTTAPGADDSAAAPLMAFGPYSGYWAMILIVASTVSLM